MKRYSCLNCGTYGHATRLCNLPITSYGLICFKKINNEINYVMIQKKDTIAYTEFLRGKWELNDLIYIKRLFSKMTLDEKKSFLNFTFDELWKKLWNHTNQEPKYVKECNKSSVKFKKLKDGYHVKQLDGKIIMVNIEHFILNTLSLHEQDWEFPKGRRKQNESDIECSLREFTEEVGICDNIQITDQNKQFEEVFQGSNNVRYRNIYYIAEYKGDSTTIRFNENNLQQAKEVRNVKWFSYPEALDNIIKHDNHEKRELFKRMNTLIHKYYVK